MTTLAFQIGPTGASAPSLENIVAVLTANVRQIYGDDTYLDADSQDGQFINVFATAINDLNQQGLAVYRSYSPTYAVGAGLSAQVKINGLARLVASNSQQNFDIVGQAGKEITNGIIGDDAGKQWALPASVIIPLSGTITETALCTESGAITFVGTPRIVTPTPGWQAANLNGSTTPGAPVETDAALRQRQAVSTSLPALTPLPAIYADVANLTGVERLMAYENDTGSTDSNGIAGHTIALVVEGGDAVQIATAIASKKNPGTGTAGTTVEVIIDSAGVPNTIRFYALSPITMKMLVNIHNLAGYVSTTATAIQQAVAQFWNSLSIGEDSYYGRLFSPVNLSGDAAVGGTGQAQLQLDTLSETYDITSIYQARADNMTANGAATAGATSVTVNSVTSYAIGKAIACVLDDNSILNTTITNIVGSVLTIANAVPGGRSIPNGALIYVAGNVVIAFNEAASGSVANVKVTVS
jgi:hypothetical protein